MQKHPPTVELKTFATKNFRLRSGEVRPQLKLVYQSYGTMAPDRRNAILLAHGYTSSQHAAVHDSQGQVGW